ncbi:MAG TPA: DUF1653 domain-containing protein [Mobilitalea sp.]|nr:DUF1653 domain-containing protein [Mobilitalea sp.]
MDNNRLPKQGEIYKHFKGKPYQIITVATHTETKEAMVVYQALYGNFKTYVRPMEMFLSEVDHVKYPDVKQKFRFELWNPDITVEESDAVKVSEVAAKSNTAAEPLPSITLPDTDEKVITDNKEQLSGQNENYDINTPDGSVNLLLLKFLDAESYTKKLEVLTTNKKHLDDRLINDMAVALDCAVNEGPLEQRIQELINCLEAMRRFEDRRLR